MTILNLTENELAERWGVSPKTLQRWRSERRGPSYLKLSKRVTYPIEDILAFERSQKKIRQNSHDFALLQKESSTVPVPAIDPLSMDSGPRLNGPGLVSCDEAISATKLPRYFFMNAEMRKRLEIPHYHMGSTVRYRLSELRQWEISRACEAFSISNDSPASAERNENSASTPDLSVGKLGLHEALRKLNNGTLLK
jgi:predicted DNA-binding transcriptional regulator AlpA